MEVEADRPCEVSNAVATVNQQIKEAMQRRPEHMKQNVLLVAVSKTKPKTDIMKAYKEGVRNFAENYIHELLEKSNDSELMEMCPEIQWHYIGRLQSNKIPKLVKGCPRLFCIETIDTKKAADLVQKDVKFLRTHTSMDPMSVLIQVNTSGEESKGGVSRDELEDLLQHILNNCPDLAFDGLMTIGRANHDLSNGPNPDYLLLCDLKASILDKYSDKIDHVNLSMGTSHDFEHAIELGASSVRVGEKIFGQRRKIEH